jgi:hypothetical protein
MVLRNGRPSQCPDAVEGAENAADGCKLFQLKAKKAAET